MIEPSSWEKHTRQIDDLFKELEAKVNQEDRIEIGGFWTNPDFLCIADPSPLVVLFGPEGSGKTMSLLRLTWFLRENGYEVIPDVAFRCDEYYRTECELFNQMRYNPSDVFQTRLFFMMLVKVIDKKGRTVCQILDTPGSFFFDSDITDFCNDWKKNWQDYFFWNHFLDYLKRLPNKRLWSFYKEKDWDSYRARKNDMENLMRIYQVIGRDKDRIIRLELGDGELHQQYVKRIEHFVKRNLSSEDKSVFVLNKVDKVNGIYIKDLRSCMHVFRCGTVLSPFKEINYKGFPYRTKLLGLINISEPFVLFSSGTFLLTETGKVLYNVGGDVYPKMLWEAILRSIKK